MQANDLVTRLARAFDQGFAEPPDQGPTSFVDFLAVRVGGDAYALSMTDVAGLFPDHRIVPLPGAASGFLGVVGLRGTILPAYGLRDFLGYPPDAAPRWLALAGRARQVALAFDHVDGYVRARPEDVISSVNAAHARSYVRATVRTPFGLCAVVDALAVLHEIDARVYRDSP